MPITRRQFELGIDHQLEEYMRRIYDLLQAHEDEAYSAEELGAELGLTEFDLTDWQRLNKALERLVAHDVTSERRVLDKRYYATGHNSLSSVLEP